jgi:hypothetical protein
MKSLDSDLNPDERKILKLLLDEYKKTGKFLTVSEIKNILELNYDTKIEEKMIQHFAKRGFIGIGLEKNHEVLLNFIIDQYSKFDSIHTLDEIKKNLNISSRDLDEGLSKLARIGVLYREKEGDDRVIPRIPKIGYDHKTTLRDGRTLNPIEAACVIDALGLPFTYNQDATIISKDPISQKEIKIEIKDGKIFSQNPKNLTAYLGSQCSTTLLFTSEDNVKEWEKKHPDQHGVTISMEQALELARRLFENRLELDYVSSVAVSYDTDRQTLIWETIDDDNENSCSS